MGRRAAYSVEVHGGRQIGYGLVVRAGEVYSVQFRDVDGTKFVIRSTGEPARPRALKKAEQIIKEHYAPPDTIRRQADWNEVIPEFRRQLETDAARPATIKDYLDTIQQVRGAVVGPAALSAGVAQQWCNKYLTGTFTRAKGEGAKTYTRSPVTLHSRVRKLSAIWSKYFVRRMRVADANPWETVDLPKLEEKPIRTLSAERVDEFFAWLAARWQGWALPSLFFEVKAATGCRLGDLAAIRSAGLEVVKNGDETHHLISFEGATTKARKARVAVLEADLFTQVKVIAGPTYVWERYATDIAKYLALRGVPTHRTNPQFGPERLTWWAKDEVDDFNKAHPDRPKIQSHDFRKRFITEAHKGGEDVDQAAAAVGMTGATARQYYNALDQRAAAIAVAGKLGGKLRPKKTGPKADA